MSKKEEVKFHLECKKFGEKYCIIMDSNEGNENWVSPELYNYVKSLTHPTTLDSDMQCKINVLHKERTNWIEENTNLYKSNSKISNTLDKVREIVELNPTNSIAKQLAYENIKKIIKEIEKC